MSNTIPDNYVRLVLHRGSDLYLEVPIAVVLDLVLKPFKFLRYLGWSILGVAGDLLDAQGVPVDLESVELIPKSTYQFCYQETDNLFKYAVDLEVIKQHSVYSCSSACNVTFCQSLEMRDMCYAFTSLTAPLVGMHIIPHSRGDDWLNLILANRPTDGETLDDFHGIDDVRNGILGNSIIHGLFDTRVVVILKTPNPMLQPEDIQPRAASNLRAGTEYPDGSRYTLQWIVPFDPIDILFTPNNTDARFVIGTSIPKPSDLLLHYNFGAAVVKHWGRNQNILVERPNIPRPKPEDPTSKKQYKHFDHEASREERAGRKEGDASRSDIKEPGGPVQGAGWDEDDIMLFFWGNTPQARARRMKEQGEKKAAIDQWRLSVGVD